jgi:hypothetical protein
MLLLTRITHRSRHHVHRAMKAYVLQIRIRKARIALSVILTPEVLGMTIHRRLLPAMNAMRTRVLHLHIL